MADLTIKINLDNDAFQPTWEPEVRSILMDLIRHIDMGNMFLFSSHCPVSLSDSNGNITGKVTLTEDEEE